MFEAGLHAYHSTVWEQRKPKCAHSSVDVAPIDLEHFSSALYLLAIGMLLSAAVCVAERIVHAVTARRDRNRRRVAERQAAWNDQRRNDDVCPATGFKFIQ